MLRLLGLAQTPPKIFCCGTKGKEYSQAFARPQSWKELQGLASRDDRERVPKVLQDDVSFALIFGLVYQHRTQLSLIKHLDSMITAPLQN